MRNYLAGYILGPFQETSCHSKFQFQFYTELLKTKRIKQFMEIKKESRNTYSENIINSKSIIKENCLFTSVYHC